MPKAARPATVDYHFKQLQRIDFVQADPDLDVLRHLWKVDSETFSTCLNISLGQSGASVPPMSLSTIYQYLCTQNQGALQRLVLVSLFEALMRAGYHGHNKWRRDSRASLSKIIARTLHVHAHDVARNLGVYATQGKKFHEWVTKLGGYGYLFALPTNLNVQVSVSFSRL